jgi:predicted dehydrogenase
MEKVVSVLLVGAGGYGNHYANALLDNEGGRKYKLAGVVDPKPENCSNIYKIRELGIPVFDTIEEFYSNNHCDLAVISTPIQFHCPQVCYSLRQGSNVLCEKPMCASIEDAVEMIRARDKSGKFLAIGYQWSFNENILKLKTDILEGKFGKPVRLKTLVLWPRDEQYYSRGWAGRKFDGSGRLVLDSVANNATAHYLHNMFFVLGKDIVHSAVPLNVTAELYRANKIENYDTAALRAITTEGTEILFFASHAVIESVGPILHYEFEKAKVTFLFNAEKNNSIKVCYHDGTENYYGNPNNSDIQKLWVCIDAVNRDVVIPCGPEAALSHTACINGMHDSMPEIVNFPKEIIKHDGSPAVTWVEGLGESLTSCFKNCVIPAEIGLSWASHGNITKINYPVLI